MSEQVQFQNEHGPGFVLPAEREVDCGCDPQLARPVLRDPTGWNDRITACTSCGKVSLTETLVSEPHPNDVQCVGNRIADIAPDVLGWVSMWPRLAWGVWGEDRSIYLPASLRCHTVAELESQEREFLARQKNQSIADRLASVSFPHEPPPAGLPKSLQTFADTQAGLLLTPRTDLQTLLSRCDPGDWAMPFAYAHLKNRADFTKVLVDLLCSGDVARRDTAISLIGYGRINQPEIVTAIIGLLEHVQLDQQGNSSLHRLLDTVYWMGHTAAAARPILTEIASKIGDRDYYLRKRVEQVRELIK